MYYYHYFINVALIWIQPQWYHLTFTGSMISMILKALIFIVIIYAHCKFSCDLHTESLEALELNHEVLGLNIRETVKEKL